MRPRWLSFPAALNDEGRYAHQVEPDNPTALCGVSMFPATQWKPAGRKPKCESCLTLMRRTK